VVGLSGETAEYVRQTRQWVDTLSDEPLGIFPVLNAPTDGSQGPGRDDLAREQWELIRACYRVNFRWMPKMYDDGQRAAGVGRGRRILMQLLGRGQAALWKSLLMIRTRRADGR